MMLIQLTRTFAKVGATGAGVGLFTNSFVNPGFLSVQAQNLKSMSSIYDFSAIDIDGHHVKLDKYKGHVCIIVNVASK